MDKLYLVWYECSMYDEYQQELCEITPSKEIALKTAAEIIEGAKKDYEEYGVSVGVWIDSCSYVAESNTFKDDREPSERWEVGY